MLSDDEVNAEFAQMEEILMSEGSRETALSLAIAALVLWALGVTVLVTPAIIWAAYRGAF